MRTVQQTGKMNRSKEPGFADRQSAAATAKKATLEKHRAMLSDPGVAERQVVRQAVVTARESRAAERKTAQAASTTREATEKVAEEAAEQAARETALRAKRTAREAAAEARAARDLALETKNRAALDARKAKKRKGR
jgi:hypothetical protein